MTVVGAVIVLVSLVGLGVQAVRGDPTVGVQRQAATVRDADLDDAFYHCIDVQTRSLVAPGQPVAFATADLADFVTLLKGAGSWITIADPVVPGGGQAVAPQRRPRPRCLPRHGGGGPVPRSRRRHHGAGRHGILGARGRSTARHRPL